MNRTLVAVDTANLYFCIKQKFGAKAKLDYKKYLAQACKQGAIPEQLSGAVAFITTQPNDSSRFVDCLASLGYQTMVKDRKEIQTTDGVKLRGSWTTGMAVKLIGMMEKYETLILGSSHDENIHLIDYLQDRGVKVRVVACGVQAELKDACEWEEIGPALIINEE